MAKSKTRKPAHGATREQRALFIARKIATRQWKHGSGKYWAEQWGLAPETVSRITKEAVEHLAKSVGDKELLYAELVCGLRDIFFEATRTKDWRHAIDAGRELGRLAGAGAPDRIELRLKELSDEELHARYKAALERAKREYEEPCAEGGGSGEPDGGTHSP